MKATDIEKKFAEGVEDVIGDLDLCQPTRPNQPMRRVNVDFPHRDVRGLSA
jgi:hypothetical protein